jgi:glycosyltransferase involved in cell wall biosynthesis
MSLCISMIVKNEAHIIQRCLRSVKPFIDSYSISDTGSTDNTMDIIREELAGIPGVLASDPWQDFGTNRNISLSRCEGDFVLFIDADDTLETTGGKLKLARGYDGFEMRVHFPELVDWHVKIIRNDPRWRWEGKVHDNLVFEGNPKLSKLENFSLMIHGDGDRTRRGDKFERDLKIFESEAPTPRNVFYHAATLEALNRKNEAISKYYERARLVRPLDGPGGWDEEIYSALLRAAKLMIGSRPLDIAAAALFRAYFYRPGRMEALVALCRLLRNVKRYDESYRLSMVHPEPSTDTFLVDRNAEWQILEEHALAAYHLNHVEEAREYYDVVSRYDLPVYDRERIENNLMLCTSGPNVKEKDWSWSPFPIVLSITSPEDTAIELDLARSEKLTEDNPTPDNLLQLSVVYYRMRLFGACIVAAKDALKLKPDFPEAWNNICCAYNGLNEFANGKAAGEEALRLRPGWTLAQNNLNWSINELEKG